MITRVVTWIIIFPLFELTSAILPVIDISITSSEGVESNSTQRKWVRCAHVACGRVTPLKVKYISHISRDEIQGWVNEAQSQCNNTRSGTFRFNSESSTTARYELSDVFHDHGNGRATRNKEHLENFRGSIASHYIQRSHGKPGGFALLARIVDERIASVYGEGNSRLNATVIHLRTGDVVEEDNRTVFELLSSEWWTGYVKPLSYFEGTRIPRLPGKIVLVSGSHTSSPGGNVKSCVYLQAMARYWRSRGWDVEVRTHGSADEDVLFMSRAAFFVRSGGRLGELVGRLVTRNGGVLLPRPGEFDLLADKEKGLLVNGEEEEEEGTPNHARGERQVSSRSELRAFSAFTANNNLKAIRDAARAASSSSAGALPTRAAESPPRPRPTSSSISVATDDDEEKEVERHHPPTRPTGPSFSAAHGPNWEAHLLARRKKHRHHRLDLARKDPGKR